MEDDDDDQPVSNSGGSDSGGSSGGDSGGSSNDSSPIASSGPDQSGSMAVNEEYAPPEDPEEVQRKKLQEEERQAAEGQAEDQSQDQPTPRPAVQHTNDAPIVPPEAPTAKGDEVNQNPAEAAMSDSGFQPPGAGAQDAQDGQPQDPNQEASSNTGPAAAPGQPGQSQVPPQTLNYLTRGDAMHPQYANMLKQVVNQDGTKGKEETNLLAIDHAAKNYGMDVASDLLAHDMKMADHYWGGAAAAASAGDMAKAAHYATQGYQNIPDGLSVSFQGTRNGALVQIAHDDPSLPPSNVQLSRDEFVNLMRKTNLSDFAMSEEGGFGKALDHARGIDSDTGQRVQLAQADTGTQSDANPWAGARERQEPGPIKPPQQKDLDSAVQAADPGESWEPPAGAAPTARGTQNATGEAPPGEDKPEIHARPLSEDEKVQRPWNEPGYDATARNKEQMREGMQTWDDINKAPKSTNFKDYVEKGDTSEFQPPQEADRAPESRSRGLEAPAAPGVKFQSGDPSKPTIVRGGAPGTREPMSVENPRYDGKEPAVIRGAAGGYPQTTERTIRNADGSVTRSERPTSEGMPKGAHDVRDENGYVPPQADDQKVLQEFNKKVQDNEKLTPEEQARENELRRQYGAKGGQPATGLNEGTPTPEKPAARNRNAGQRTEEWKDDEGITHIDMLKDGQAPAHGGRVRPLNPYRGKDGIQMYNGPDVRIVRPGSGKPDVTYDADGQPSDGSPLRNQDVEDAKAKEAKKRGGGDVDIPTGKKAEAPSRSAPVQEAKEGDEPLSKPMPAEKTGQPPGGKGPTKGESWSDYISRLMQRGADLLGGENPSTKSKGGGKEIPVGAPVNTDDGRPPARDLTKSNIPPGVRDTWKGYNDNYKGREVPQSKRDQFEKQTGWRWEDAQNAVRTGAGTHADPDRTAVQRDRASTYRDRLDLDKRREDYREEQDRRNFDYRQQHDKTSSADHRYAVDKQSQSHENVARINAGAHLGAARMNSNAHIQAATVTAEAHVHAAEMAAKAKRAAAKWAARSAALRAKASLLAAKAHANATVQASRNAASGKKHRG